MLKNNQKKSNGFLAGRRERVRHYAIRKLSVGVASVAVATFLVGQAPVALATEVSEAAAATSANPTLDQAKAAVQALQKAAGDFGLARLNAGTVVTPETRAQLDDLRAKWQAAHEEANRLVTALPDSEPEKAELKKTLASKPPVSQEEYEQYAAVTDADGDGQADTPEKAVELAEKASGDFGLARSKSADIVSPAIKEKLDALRKAWETAYERAVKMVRELEDSTALMTRLDKVSPKSDAEYQQYTAVNDADGDGLNDEAAKPAQALVEKAKEATKVYVDAMTSKNEVYSEQDVKDLTNLKELADEAIKTAKAAVLKLQTGEVTTGKDALKATLAEEEKKLVLPTVNDADGDGQADTPAVEKEPEADQETKPEEPKTPETGEEPEAGKDGDTETAPEEEGQKDTEAPKTDGETQPEAGGTTETPAPETGGDKDSSTDGEAKPEEPKTPEKGEEPETGKDGDTETAPEEEGKKDTDTPKADGETQPEVGGTTETPAPETGGDQESGTDGEAKPEEPKTPEKGEEPEAGKDGDTETTPEEEGKKDTDTPKADGETQPEVGGTTETPAPEAGGDKDSSTDGEAKPEEPKTPEADKEPEAGKDGDTETTPEEEEKKDTDTPKPDGETQPEAGGTTETPAPETGGDKDSGTDGEAKPEEPKTPETGEEPETGKDGDTETTPEEEEKKDIDTPKAESNQDLAKAKELVSDAQMAVMLFTDALESKLGIYDPEDVDGLKNLEADAQAVIQKAQEAIAKLSDDLAEKQELQEELDAEKALLKLPEVNDANSDGKIDSPETGKDKESDKDGEKTPEEPKKPEGDKTPDKDKQPDGDKKPETGGDKEPGKDGDKKPEDDKKTDDKAPQTGDDKKPNQEDQKLVTLTDKAHKVTVILTTKDAKHITAIQVAKVTDKLPKGLSAKSLDLYDIKTVDEKGKFQQIADPALVTLPVAKGQKVAKIIYYLPETGMTEDLAFYWDEAHNTVSFMVTHFSQYGIVYASQSTKAEDDKKPETGTKPETPKKPEANGETKKPENQGKKPNAKKPETLSRVAKKQQLPNTGDSSLALSLLVGILNLSGVAALASRRKRD